MLNKVVVVVIDVSYCASASFSELNNYLTPLLTRFVGSESGPGNTANSAQQQQGVQHPLVEIAVVLFKDYSPFAEFSVRSSEFASDLKDVRWWLNNLPFGEGYCSGDRPMADALCSAIKLTTHREAKEKHIILVTHSIPTDSVCHACNHMDDCFSHVARMKKMQIFFSLIASRHFDGLQKLFDSGRLEQEEVPAIKTSSPSHLVLLRGLSLTSAVPSQPQPQPTAIPPVAPAPPTAVAPVSNPQEAKPFEAVSVGIKPLWEGVLTWPSSQNAATPFCELIAYPANRSDPDVTTYGAAEWPPTLSVSGVAYSKDPNISPHYKNARFIEFVPVKGKNEPQYRNLYLQLAQKSWAAVIYLQNKTLLILPHNDKLIGLLLPKLALTQRPTTDAKVSATNTAPRPLATSLLNIPLTLTIVDPTPVTNVISNTKPLVGSITPGFSVGAPQISPTTTFQSGMPIPTQRTQANPTPFRPGSNFPQTNPTLLQQQLQMQRNTQANITNPHFPL